MDHIYRESTQTLVKQLANKIVYTDKYQDEETEFRHVFLPKQLAKVIPKGTLLSEREWRSLGIQQSLGWEHYMVHRPEPHILLFRRSKNFDQAAALQLHAQAMAAAEAQMQRGGAPSREMAVAM